MCGEIEKKHFFFFLNFIKSSSGFLTKSVIGLGPRDARFHTLNWKNAHNIEAKCANFASIISILYSI